MKSWFPLVVLVCALLLMLWLRHSYRADATRWLAAHLRGGQARARTWGTGIHLGSAAAALGVLGLGWWLTTLGDPWTVARFLAAGIVLFTYVPVATLGSPKLTRWQKSFDQRLVEAGADAEAARAFAPVARFFSGFAVLVAVGAVFLAAFNPS